MSLNKHKIIPLIESYYHTFTPLERTIADFFIHNTEEQDFLPEIFPGSFMYLKLHFHVSPRNVDFTDTENLFMSISRAWHQVPKKIFRILKYRNLILIRNF